MGRVILYVSIECKVMVSAYSLWPMRTAFLHALNEQTNMLHALLTIN